MDDLQARALIAGTLALMTSFAETRCPFGAEKIYENLLLLSGRPDMPWELRAALAKLGARWALLGDESRGGAGEQVAVRH